jgi:DNA-directed RNA polymerase specialized sigma24 family protein
MRRVCDRDESALALLFDLYHHLVFATALHALGSNDSAEQLTHAAFLNIWSNAHEYKRGSLAVWIVAVTRRVCRNSQGDSGKPPAPTEKSISPIVEGDGTERPTFTEQTSKAKAGD